MRYPQKPNITFIAGLIGKLDSIANLVTEFQVFFFFDVFLELQPLKDRFLLNEFFVSCFGWVMA